MGRSRRLFRRFLVPLAVGLLTAGLTAGSLLFAERNPYGTRIPVVSDLLTIGVIVALIPFGGIHESRLGYPAVLALASLFNGALWGGLAAAALAVYRGIRRVRRAASEEHVT